MPDAAPAAHRAAAARARTARGVLLATLLSAAALVAGTWPVFDVPVAGVYTGGAVPRSAPLHLLAGRAAPPAGPPQRVLAWDVAAAQDVLRGVWTLAWWSHAMRHLPVRSWLDANALYPVDDALVYADLQLGAVPWFAPAYWLSGDPVLAYQLALLLSGMAGGACFFVLVRRWTSSTAAGLAAAVIGTVAPFRLDQMKLLYLFAIPYLPATLLAVDAIVAGRRRVAAAAVLAAGLALQASSSAYLAYTAFLLVPAYAGVLLLEERRPGAARAVVWLGAACLVAAAASLALYRPFFAHLGGALPTEGQAAAERSIGLVFWWLFPGRNLYAHFVEGVGVPVVILAAFGVLHAGSRRRWAALAVCALGGILALGHTTRIGSVFIPNLPWAWLAAVVPGFGAQRHSVLTTTIVGIGMTCLAGLGVAWLLERGRSPRVRAVAAMLLLAAGAWEVWRWTGRTRAVLPMARPERIPPAYRWLALHGDGAPLLELPATLDANAVYAYFSTYHWLPLFNGTFAVEPPGYADRLARAGTALDPAAAPAFLRDVPVRWILVHGDLLRPDDRAAADATPPHLERVERFGSDVLYRVVTPPGAAPPA